MASVLLLLAAAAALVGRLLLSLFYRFQTAQKARQRGCEAAPLMPCADPFGFSNLRAAVRADRAKALPELAESRVKLISDLHNRLVTTYRIRIAGRESILTVDPKNIQAVLATQFKDFDLGPHRRRGVLPLLGTGIFAADGENWSHSRALLRPQFTRDQISNLDLEEQHLQNALQAIPAAGSDGWTGPVDIQTIFFRLTVDSATEFLFGESCNSQLGALHGNTDSNTANFAANFDKSQWYLAERLRFEGLYWLIDNAEFRKCRREVHAFVDRYVESALKTVREEKNRHADVEKSPASSSSQQPYVFLHALAAATQDPLELRYQLINILLAGRDTTASLLSWTILMLARHPAVFHKLRQTIISEFGSFHKPQNITFATLKSCQYLQYCMNEVLRLFPVVPFNRRSANKDTTIPRGGGKDGLSPVFIKKGQDVLYNTHVMHRRKDLWGPDADVFNPDRWYEKKVSWEYVPFNGGPRICIGQQFALTEAGYVLVRLLQRFDRIEDVHGERKVRWNLSLTSSPADLVTVRLHEAAAV